MGRIKTKNKTVLIGITRNAESNTKTHCAKH